MNLPALADLAQQINVEHDACRAALQKGLAHALTCGELLAQAKAGMEHGAWLPWLAENCPEISERTAQRYMRLHAGREQIELKTANVADLTMRAAEQAIAKPSRPEPVEPEATTPEGVIGNAIELTPAERDFLARFKRDMRWADHAVIRNLGKKLSRDIAGGVQPELAEKIMDAAAMLRNPRVEMQAEIMARIERVASGIAVRPTGLHLPDGLTYEQWREVWALLSAMPGFPAART